MKYKFTSYNKEHMARSLGVALPISFKDSIEICNFLRNRKVTNAKNVLKQVTEKTTAVPIRRFNMDLAHKKKIGPGKYPMKASQEFIKLIESAEANAQFKGLNTSNLIITHISANKASKSWHYGRQFRRKMKRTNIEIVLEEKAQSKDKADLKSTTKKADSKSEPKKSETKTESKKPETKETQSKSQTQKPSETKPAVKKEEPKTAKKDSPQPKQEVKDKSTDAAKKAEPNKASKPAKEQQKVDNSNSEKPKTANTKVDDKK